MIIIILITNIITTIRTNNTFLSSCRPVIISSPLTSSHHPGKSLPPFTKHVGSFWMMRNLSYLKQKQRVTTNLYKPCWPIWTSRGSSPSSHWVFVWEADGLKYAIKSFKCGISILVKWPWPRKKRSVLAEPFFSL